MGNKHGDWIWYELMTPDADGAAKFYGELVGWAVGDQPEYREIQAGSTYIGGMLPMSADMIAHGAKPGWVGYVAVDDVDKALTSVEHGGGRVLMPARDMPDIGRFAMVMDPAGASFYVMRPIPPADDPDAISNAFSEDKAAAGHCSWNELWTSDPEGALHFYGSRFGWVKDGEMDMPGGKYNFIRHGVVTGAIGGLTAGAKPGWVFYFRVPSIDVAIDKVKAGRGSVDMGPHEVPGGDHIIMGTDPQGAKFALVGAK